jgi:hypothetical protein
MLASVTSTIRRRNFDYATHVYTPATISIHNGLNGIQTLQFWRQQLMFPTLVVFLPDMVFQVVGNNNSTCSTFGFLFPHSTRLSLTRPADPMTVGYLFGSMPSLKLVTKTVAGKVRMPICVLLPCNGSYVSPAHDNQRFALSNPGLTRH